MAELTDYKNIWAFIEMADGKEKNISLELLNPGKRLATERKEKLIAVVVGDGVEAVAEKAIAFGADEAVVVDSPEYREYIADAYVHVLAELAGKYKPSVLLIGATNNGRDLGARLSARLQTGMIGDCIEITSDEVSGAILWTRPALGGNYRVTLTCPVSCPQIATVRSRSFMKLAAEEGKAGEIVRENIPTPPEKLAAHLLEVIKTATEGIKLEEADIVVSGGGGVKSAENFSLIRDLAKALGGAVGASRAAIDSGWLPHSFQVGQTGKIVQPKLYIACGISGAIQHLAGMSSAGTIIAINNDAEAPIFDVADYGIVGNLFEVIPALITGIAKLKE